ncbi:hypothetical protein KUTeg_011433 [Tegillarca granosa]|uniref:B box-type domain-containing protein n=1 Tax=Tegillarca granosa TaxID=220873 RepID=A0ABQ9F0R0_TEGGR|nr:hypothetical protein KUTeg_011433 [Tegillarca granosa]
MAQTNKPAAQCPVFTNQKCELCEINDIMFQCKDCDELMCETCQKSHLKSKASKNHKMVCLISPEMYQINKTWKKCQSHTEEDLLMYCNTCNVPICRECIASRVHPNHSMVKVEEVIDTKQQELSNIIRQTNEKSERYKDILKTITRNKMQFSKSVAKTIKESKARNKQLKIRLDNIESEYIKQLENKDKVHTEAMAKLEQRLLKEMSDLNQLIQQCESKQGQRNVEMAQFVTGIMQQVDKYTYCEQPDEESPPNLITRDVDDQELKDLFGHLDMRRNPEVDHLLQLNTKVPTAIPVIDVKIISNFTSENTQVVTKSNDQALLWRCGERGISLVTSDGDVIQHIHTDFCVYDAVVSTSGDLFVTEDGGNTVKKITRHNLITDIYTEQYKYMARGITVTVTGNVLVVLYNSRDCKIVEIKTSGKHIRTIHDPVNNKQLCKFPHYEKIVVLNKQGQRRFKYQAEGRQLKESFSPQYVVTDTQGHIIISDYYNSVVHVLDKNGKFIQYLISPEHGCHWPVGLDFDNHGRLWVCNTGKKEIDIIKYL